MPLPPQQQGLYDQWQSRMNTPSQNTQYGANTSGQPLITETSTRTGGVAMSPDQAQYATGGAYNDPRNQAPPPPPPPTGNTGGVGEYDISGLSQKRQDFYNSMTPQQQADFQARFPDGFGTGGAGVMPGPPTVGGTDPGGTDGGGSQMPPPNGTNPQGPYDQWPSAQPSPADYQSVQDYADQAHSAARRYLDPQQAQQNRRFDQELINRGIDPNSEAGRLAADQLAREQSDANNAASFSALGFGQGIQQQMFGQNYQNRGMDLQQQAQDWSQMMGLEGIDFRNRGYNDSLQMYQDQLLMAMLYGTPIPGGSQTNPYGGSSGGGWNFGWGS